MQPSHLAGVLAVLLASLALHLYQARRARALSRDPAWGVETAAAFKRRVDRAQLVGWLGWRVDVVHFDVDHLKRLNAALGEERVNALLLQALRASDVARLQHGDELAALPRRGEGQRVARSIASRLAGLPLEPDERAALGGPITATFVVVEGVADVRGAILAAVRERESLKRQDRRGVILAVGADGWTRGVSL